MLYDKRNKRLTLARDRIGARPLFYTWHNGTLVFADIARIFPSLIRATERPILCSAPASLQLLNAHVRNAGTRLC